MRTPLWIALTCAACGASPRAADDPAPPVCDLGPPVGPSASTPSPGYPIVRPQLDTATYVARTAELEALAPGWTVALSIHGEPVRLETSAVIGAYEPAVSDARVQEVRDALVALALIEPTATVRADAMYVSVADHPELTIQQITRADGVVLRVDRAEPPAALPPGVRELTDDELRGAWGPGWAERQAEVSTFIEGHPCDLVVGHEHACDGAGPRTERACVALGELRLERRVVEAADGAVRFVAVLTSAAWSPGATTIAAAVPTCVDAVTGEALAAGCD